MTKLVPGMLSATPSCDSNKITNCTLQRFEVITKRWEVRTYQLAADACKNFIHSFMVMSIFMTCYDQTWLDEDGK